MPTTLALLLSHLLTKMALRHDLKGSVLEDMSPSAKYLGLNIVVFLIFLVRKRKSETIITSVEECERTGSYLYQLDECCAVRSRCLAGDLFFPEKIKSALSSSR